MQFLILVLAFVGLAFGQARKPVPAGQYSGWGAYHGGPENLHYSTIGQITPANVSKLKVAWTLDTGDAFEGSEIQCNPLVLNGVIYATSPKLRVMAIDGATGKEIWKVERQEASSWAPPSVVTVGGRKQIIVAASTKVRAYDYQTGKVIWECGGLGSNVIPAPVFYNNTVIVMSGHREPNRMAIKLGRDGDLTGTDAVVWSNTKGNSYTPSPVLHEGKLYFVTDNGILSAINAGTGELYYQERLPGTYSLKASLVAANGNLYVSTEQGDVLVVKMGEKFEVVATNKMADEFFIASPAIADGEMYLRGKNTLYLIRQK